MFKLSRGVSSRSERKAFTLVELLVVIGIIGVLIAVLLPALSKARRQAQEVQCMSNLRQWGMGFYMYADSNKGLLPCDGPDGSNTTTQLIGPPNGVNTAVGATKLTGIDDPSLWYNAIPPRVNGKPYYDLIELNQTSPGTLPHAGSNSIFVCPGAWDVGSQADTISPSGDYIMCNCVDPAFSRTAAVQRPSYMSYVFNSKLFGTDAAGIGHFAWKLSQLRPSSYCVLMTEKISNYGEYKDPIVQQKVNNWGGPNTPNINATGYRSTFGQLKANWTRFAARHRHGGFLLYADGHVEWHRWDEIQPGPNTPTTPVDDNIQGVAIWNPLGPV